MNALRAQPLIHGVVLAASVAAAVGVFTRDKEPKALAQGDIVVWSGRPADVQAVSYESKTRKVAIEAKKDSVGRYFVGTLEREASPPPRHEQHDGVDQEEPAAPVKTTVGFVSVGPGDRLAESLAPLKALRALGKIAADRDAEFGLTEPEATVTVTVGGTEHKLLVGGVTPGGGDRYVRLPSTGEVYVLRGEALRNLVAPDSLLIERELHEWKDNEVTRVRVEAGGKGREMVRGGVAGKRFWADVGTPETNDETLGNWMTKLDRLRPTEFSVTPPEGKVDVLRMEYTSNKPLGFLELVKVPGGDKPAYFLRTERTRLYGKVAPTLAEQVEQDLGTIVK